MKGMTTKVVSPISQCVESYLTLICINTDRARQGCSLLCTCSNADPVQAFIVRQIVSQVLVTIDQVYSAEPTPMSKIKERIDKYIDRKVDEKIQELLEYCNRIEASAKAQAIKNSARISPCADTRMLSRKTTGTGYSSDSGMEEIPLDDVTIEIPGSSADDSKKGKKSVLKRIFKQDKKPAEVTDEDTSFCLTNIFQKFPNV
ncbi:uncharacterized protein LOC135473953 isoform X2 [Liolophura sinensis]|uniref:uncharacterized protein LOC135473953 isoform X2 n=1 Tax=Liolophura sinensis TaxID=3198878 RepID=UPI003158DB3A